MNLPKSKTPREEGSRSTGIQGWRSSWISLCLQDEFFRSQEDNYLTLARRRKKECHHLEHQPIMPDNITLPLQRRPALIPKDAKLGPDDIRSICTRTGHAIIPPPDPATHRAQADPIRSESDKPNRGTKRKASTSNDRTYETTQSTPTAS
jgi:hypothetical protein